MKRTVIACVLLTACASSGTEEWKGRYISEFTREHGAPTLVVPGPMGAQAHELYGKVGKKYMKDSPYHELYIAPLLYEGGEIYTTYLYRTPTLPSGKKANCNMHLEVNKQGIIRAYGAVCCNPPVSNPAAFTDWLNGTHNVTCKSPCKL